MFGWFKELYLLISTGVMLVHLIFIYFSPLFQSHLQPRHAGAQKDHQQSQTEGDHGWVSDVFYNFFLLDAERDFSLN